ncbi:MAG: exopolysaccharide Pel transporter PelG [Tatlockia sp.]|nr:exopolysaccharide Pel transporter PelG [Tatlockia sp.]
MAGIGIELQKLSTSNSFLGFVRAHLYAGILSSGAWIVSICILIGIYFYLEHKLGHTTFAIQFLVAVTYLIASSLITSGVFQNSLNRFISDQIFESKLRRICPNFLASILILTLITTPLSYFSVDFLLNTQSIGVKLLMTSSFVTLNIIWLFTNALSGLKNYRFLLFSFVASYLIIFILAINLAQFQLFGLLLAFYIGHIILLVSFFIFLLKSYPSNHLFSQDIFRFMKINRSLVYSSLFFYLALWIDKFCFWYYSNTSTATLDRLHSSPIYDMPIFIAFLLILPGMAVFFYEMETNFSRYYDRFYDAIREGGTLKEIKEKHSEIISMARSSLLNTVQIQAAIGAFAILLAPEILVLLHLSPIYVFLLRISIVAASLLIVLIAQMNLFFYLNMPRKVMLMAIIFFLLNFLLTCLSIYLGPLYYGFGFALATLISVTIAMFLLINSFKKLTYYAFMSN